MMDKDYTRYNIMDIVVAKYKEDIRWVRKFKKSKIFIYDKSNDTDSKYITLPNIGREAHTYLTHIINNYENLSDYTCFLQGNPSDGFKGSLNVSIEFIDNFNQDINFFPVNQLTTCDLDGGPLHSNLEIKKLIFDKYFNKTPDVLIFPVGAQFIVSKKAILNRKKEFYQEIIKEFDRLDIDNKDTNGASGQSGNKMPWVCERVWTYFFNINYESKYDSK